MKDFLAGTFGKFLQLVFSVVGFGLLIAGLVSCGTTGGVGGFAVGSLLILLGVLCFCAVFGVRYWLGHVMRIR